MAAALSNAIHSQRLQKDKFVQYMHMHAPSSNAGPREPRPYPRLRWDVHDMLYKYNSAFTLLTLTVHPCRLLCGLQDSSETLYNYNSTCLL